MIDFFFESLTEGWLWFLRVLLPLAWPLIGLAAVCVGARIWAAKVDAENGSSLAPWLRSACHAAGNISLVLLLAVGLAALQRLGTETFRRYESSAASPRFDSRDVVGGSAVRQYAPDVSTRTVNPRKGIFTVGATGMETVTQQDYQQLQQALTTQGLQNPRILKAEREGSGVVRVEAEYDELREEPTPVDNSSYDLKIVPVADADPRSNAFELLYTASFEWVNPESVPATAVFELPLPDHGGTIEDIQLTLNGKKTAATSDGLAASGEVEVGANEQVTAVVSYRTQGRGLFQLYPTTEGQSVKALDIVLSASTVVKFQRGSLTPKSEGSGKYRWSLRNAVTQQNVSVAIPYVRSGREQWWKLLLLAPMALVIFSGMLIALGEWRQPLGKLVASVAATFAGFSLPLSVTLAQPPPMAVALVSAVVVCGSAGWLLGRAGFVAAAIASGVFLSAVAGPLTAGVILLVALLGALHLAGKMAK